MDRLTKVGVANGLLAFETNCGTFIAKSGDSIYQVDEEDMQFFDHKPDNLVLWAGDKYWSEASRRVVTLVCDPTGKWLLIDAEYAVVDKHPHAEAMARQLSLENYIPIRKD